MGTTLQEQLDWLDQAREAEADLGFLGRMLALCSLPRTTTRASAPNSYAPTAPSALAMSAGGTSGKLPYGNLPRRLAGLGLHRGCPHRPSVSLVLGKSLRELHAPPGNLQQ